MPEWSRMSGRWIKFLLKVFVIVELGVRLWL